jgi:hypothetical protein
MLFQHNAFSGTTRSKRAGVAPSEKMKEPFAAFLLFGHGTPATPPHSVPFFRLTLWLLLGQ